MLAYRKSFKFKTEIELEHLIKTNEGDDTDYLTSSFLFNICLYFYYAIKEGRDVREQRVKYVLI